MSRILANDIKMMLNKPFLLLAILVLTACSAPAPAPTTTPSPQQRALEAVAAALQVDPQAVTLTLQPATWPDACLGLPQPDEACAEVITDGYGGMARVGDLQFEVRTNADGSDVRLIPGAALSARQLLAQQLQRPLEDFRFALVEAVQWPDDCLGIDLPEQTCAPTSTPGYRVALQVDGETYTFHTDQFGGDVRLAAAPPVSIPDAALIWSRREAGRCMTATFGSQMLAFGACGGVQMGGRYVLPERAAALAVFTAAYAPFEAETPAGYVRLSGQGTTVATQAEQRMVAEWAALAWAEAMGGRSGAAYGWALSWSRQGGLAGFCDEVTVYVTGEALVSSCRSATGTPMRVRLNADQLARLYGWLDTLSSFEDSHTDPATADAMTVSLQFGGRGTQPPADVDIQAIHALAAELAAAARP